MSWGEELRVETPEQIDVGMQIAGPGSRAAAQLIDWLLKGLVLAVLGLIALVIGASLLTPGNETIVYLAWGLLGFLAFVYFLGYDVYYEGCRHGQTPGKKNLGIRVVRDAGGPIDVRAAAIRNTIGLADFLPGFYLGGGLIAMVNQRGQRLGDMAAGTVVIRDEALKPPAERLDPVNVVECLPASSEFVFTRHHLDRCSPQDRHVLESYFQRRNNLLEPARLKLIRNLLHIFLDKTKYEYPALFDSEARIEAFLAALYRDLCRVVR